VDFFFFISCIDAIDYMYVLQIHYIDVGRKSMTGGGKNSSSCQVLDGFIDADTLIIKAQVQVIRCAIMNQFVNLVH
jgi:hypothetical protein